MIGSDVSTTTTYYAYDAMGVPMATYTHRETSESRTLTLNDFLLYGSGRLGSYQVNESAGGAAPVSLVAANLRFELTDHLGTVRAVVTGQKTGTGNAEIVSLTDYYPYGMDMPGRSFQSEAYRYGYQGSERDPEMSGGAGYTTYFRALDPRIGRWLTPDAKVYPFSSKYNTMACNPILNIDEPGDIPLKHIVRDKKRYSSRFGYRIHPISKKKSFHYGIDIAAELGATMHSAAKGTVVFAGWDDKWDGYKVVIDHGKGYSLHILILRREEC